MHDACGRIGKRLGLKSEPVRRTGRGGFAKTTTKAVDSRQKALEEIARTHCSPEYLEARHPGHKAAVRKVSDLSAVAYPD